MSQRRIKKSLSRSGEKALYSSLFAASRGLHGTPLGFGSFLRNLIDPAIQSAAHRLELLLMITLHAQLIVAGDANSSVPADKVTDENISRIRACVTIEHLRRKLILRARYPRDPFKENTQVIWRSTHPMVKILDQLPEDDRDRIKEAILRTGDLTILWEPTALLPAQQAERFLDEMREVERHSARTLSAIEFEFRDSRLLA